MSYPLFPRFGNKTKRGVEFRNIQEVGGTTGSYKIVNNFHSKDAILFISLNILKSIEFLK